MDLIGKALWYIESHFTSDLSLDDVASAAGMSKFHLVRAFGMHSGQSVMRYVRSRRLSEAAKRLARENTGILDIAIEAGYGSHEAFTRAFKEQFGVTPETIRKGRSLQHIQLVEPLKMSEEHYNISPPDIVHHDALIIAGLKERYDDTTSARMPAQWQAFQPYIGHIDNQQNNVAFGVLCNSDDEGNIEYITGVQVSRYPEPSRHLDVIRVPAQTYAVFRHEGHVSEIRKTWKSIFGKWVAETDRKLVDAPQLERYGENFNPRTGWGDIQIWIPVAG